MIKKFTDHRKELAFLIGAIILGALIIGYLFFLVHVLVQKANTVFGDVETPNLGGHYDFKKFYTLFPDSAPEGFNASSSSVAPKTASSTQ